MKRILTTIAALSLAQFANSQQPPKEEASAPPEVPTKPTVVAKEKFSFAELYVRSPEKRGKLPAGIPGIWEGEIEEMGSIELRLQGGAKEFTGVLRVYDEDDLQFTVPLIKRQIIGGGVKFESSLPLDMGTLSFELSLQGKFLKGHMLLIESPEGAGFAPIPYGGSPPPRNKAEEQKNKGEEREAVTLKRRANGVAVDDPKLGGHWKGRYLGLFPIDLRLKETEKGFEGVFFMVMDGGIKYLEVKLPLTKTLSEGKKIKFNVGDMPTCYLLFEGDILTGYHLGRKIDLGRKIGGVEKNWIVFERSKPPKKSGVKE